MENISEFIAAADDYLSELEKWSNAENAAIELAKRGRDAQGLNATLPGMWFDCKAAREAALVAAKNLPETLEVTGVDSRGLLRFLKLVADGLNLPGMQGLWQTLRPDLERFAVRRGLPVVVEPAAVEPAVGVNITPPGSARVKIIAALTNHHKFENGGCLNLDSVGVNSLARMAEVASGSATNFFKENFGGHDKYKIICRNPATLVTYLKALNAGFCPWATFSNVPGE